MTAHFVSLRRAAEDTANENKGLRFAWRKESFRDAAASR
jgi:hypothetical protein